MDFDLSDEQKMLVQGVQRFVREHLGVAARRATAACREGFSARLWASYAELGWLALAIPEAAGGMGGNDIDLVLLMEELGRGLVIDPVADTSVLGVTLIEACTDAALREDLLKRIAAGHCRTALAHVEAGERSEYETSVSTRAEKIAGGWRLNGLKHRVFHAVAATHWLVSARADDASSPAIFVIDANAPGTTISDYELIDGTRACDLGLAATPATLLLSADQAGTLEMALDRTVVALSATAVGSMEAVMAMTADYLKQRVQFGQTLSKFQALQHRMAEVFIETDQARSMLYQALAALMSGDVGRRRRAVSGAKWLVTRAGSFVAAQGIQLHGGIGITEEYAVAHHYKSMLVYAQRFGNADFHLERSAGLAQGPR
jgi:alkylation response protein AidB-like acyl-CoA dehydrogenase